MTPLHISVHIGDSTCVGVLLRAGAISNAKLNDGMAPLHLAASLGP